VNLGHVAAVAPLRVRLRADDPGSEQTPWRTVGTGFVVGEVCGYEVVNRHLVVIRLEVP
jgi:hypothetical protein